MKTVVPHSGKLNPFYQEEVKGKGTIEKNLLQGSCIQYIKVLPLILLSYSSSFCDWLCDIKTDIQDFKTPI